MKELADSTGEPYPRVLIVGDANEGGEPEKNQVSLYYYYDPTGACYFHPDPEWCPSDDHVVDFDEDGGDGLGDMQVARLPLTHRWKVAKAVQNFLNKVNGAGSTNRALLTIGDVSRDGISPEGLPELMMGLRDMFTANGYQVLYMRESDYEPGDNLTRQLAMADSLNAGVDIVVNMGPVSNRSKLGGYFIQKVYEPVWDMGWLNNIGPRPFVFFGPGCDMADFDRDNPWYDPILAEMFLCNDPNKPAAVAWISHGRGHWGVWHRVFAEEFVGMLFSGEPEDLLDCFWRTKWSCWERYPEMRNYLRSLFYLGWPVGIGGGCNCSVEEPTPKPSGLAIEVSPNPSNQIVTVRFGLPRDMQVGISVYDVRGRQVVELVDGKYESGWHTVVWTGWNSRGERVSPGVYFLRIATQEGTLSRKVLLVR